MILFDQLRISDDGSKLYINAHVNNADYFKNIYIDSVVVMTADKVSETAPGTPASDYVYSKTIGDGIKKVDLVLTPADLTRTWETDVNAMSFNKADMSNTLFFVYVKCKGVPDSCTPCRLDEETTLGVVFDENILHQKVMDYTKDLVDDCNVSIGFVDFILLWNAFKAAIETEHYVAAIKFFNMLFGSADNVNSQLNLRKGCGCHG